MPSHTETTSSQSHSYTVSLGGTLDGVTTRDPVGYSAYGQAFEPNISVRMENTGDTDVVNPWIIVNGKRDWRSIDHILAEILEDGMSDREKARAIWEFARTHRYHYTCASDEVKDTVKMLNCYGYTLCWDEAYTVSNLWQAAGLKVRRGYPHGHCTTEVYYDGAYHLLDSDEHLLYLLRDNQTIASEEDLARDRDLVKRGHAYGVLQREDPQGSEAASSLFFFTGPRTGGRPRVGDHSMDLTLHPGEALIWKWEDRGKYHGHWDRPKRLSNGRMTYTPDLSTVSKWSDRLIGWTVESEGLRAGEDASLKLTIRSPYVIVGGAVKIQSEGALASLSVTHTDQQSVSLESTDTGAYSLDPAFPPDAPAVYAYTLHVTSRPGARLIDISIETELQMAPLSLPALELGENHIAYTSDSGGSVSITHEWTEKDADPPPNPPKNPEFPPDSGEVSETQFTFSWPPADGAADYHLQLSEYADFKHVQSPVFDKLVSKTPSAGTAEWSIPFEGLLNPNQDYFWRIRPRDADGQWGSWSRPWTFKIKAPGVPLDVRVDPDWDARTMTLMWEPNPQGTTPIRYEVYGSNERGFSASREPYAAMVDNKTTDTFPANHIATTDLTTLPVARPGIDLDSCSHYRVVAIDESGARSGPSDQALAPCPMILSMPEPQAVAGQTYTYQVDVTTSTGQLRAERVDDRNYVREIREGDALRYLVDEGPPEWVSIHETTGLFTATPGPEHLGFHTITIRVQNGNGGFDMQGFDLEVVRDTS